MSPVMQRSSRPAQRARLFTRIGARVGLLTLGLLSLDGCNREKLAREGRVTQMQADSYLRDAIRQSSEGVVLEPSQRGLDQIERTRLGEIAQELRRPGAICFLERAIHTMEPGEVDGEQVWVDVPEGQAKFRARIAVDGSVLSVELLESGFEDSHMETCVGDAIRRQHFVESRDSFAYFIDVYYWVSLGFFAKAQADTFTKLMRRQQAEAGLRAKTCLVGRVPAGTYEVTGLNLFDREGATVVNRIDRGRLPSDVSACIASAFKQIRIYAEPDAFIRPAAPKVEFKVAGDGTVSMSDEHWLEMIVLEERAQREMRRAELLRQTGEGSSGVDSEVPEGFIDMDLVEGRGAGSIRGDIESPNRDEISSPQGPMQPESSMTEFEPTPLLEPPVEPPVEPGTKIDLSPRRDH